MVLRSIGLRDALRPKSTARAMLLLSFLMILATMLATTALLVDLRQRELDHAKSEIVSLNRILSEQTTRTFEGVALMLRGAKERLADDMGRHLALESFPVQLLLRARAAGLPQVKSVFVVDRNGRGVNSSRADFIPRLSVRERPFFRHFADGANDELFVSLPEKARVDNLWTFYVSTRLLDPAGNFRGVLVAAISIDYFESLYDSIALDFVDRIRLLNQDGALLADKNHDETNFGQPGISPPVLEILRTGDDATMATSDIPTEGKRFTAYRQVAKYPLIVSASIAANEALAPWWRIARLIVAGVAVIVVFVLLTTFVMVRNLLRREALESELKESDEQRRQMVQTIRDAIVTVNSDNRIVLFNQAAEKMFGMSASDALTSNLDEWLTHCVPHSQGSGLARYIRDALHSPAGIAVLGIVELGAKDQEFPVELSVSSTSLRGKVLVTVVFRDLTERQQAEQDLLASNRQLQELSASLQSVREVERARIARELHDELGQLLTGMRMEISWLGSRLGAEQGKLVDKVDSVKGLIDQTIVSVRRIASELRPLVLDDLGFSAAAGWYVDQFSSRTGLPVRLQLPADDPEQGGDVGTALFRLLQESLTNIARHAEASQVAVSLARHGDEWLLVVQDDGKGFASGIAGRPGGVGLIGMRERVNILGGHFTVVSAPGKGTLIEARIPAEAKDEGKNGKI